MIELIQTDIKAIMQQYNNKNSNIALLVTALAVLIAVWRFVFLETPGRKKVIFAEHLAKERILIRICKVIWFLNLFLFVYYFSYLIELTILTREAGSRTDINLHFLGTWHPDLQSQCFMVENVLLFFPFGILIVFLYPRLKKLWKLLLISFLLSLVIETTQLITGRGFFQIDDIWLNSLGGLCGGIIGNIFIKIAVKISNNYKT